ncbi:MAG: elongation factor Ts, partial [Proteiniphilum sp.]|nr:elongation factor Ts [Proteiniphilum sp.]
SQLITDKIGTTGEKMELGYYEHITAPYVTSYIHMGNKLATIVGFNKVNVDKQVAKDVAMQVAAMSPIAVTAEEIPADIKEKELEIAREKAREAGKPENLLDRIAEGALQKFYKESTLLQQEYVKDSKKNIEQFLKENDKELTVTLFKRVSLTV